MKKIDGDEGIADVLGYSIKRAKSGLDEGQVISLVKQLVSERDVLTQRQEHLSSLTRLYEKTIAEADELANQIKREAEEQVQAESKAILASAEEKAQQILEEKKAEAIVMSEKEAEEIKTDALKKADTFLKEKADNLQSQLRDVARLLHEEVLSQFESARQRAATFEVEFEQKLSELTRQDDQTSMKEDDGTDTGINSEVIVKAAAQAHTEDDSDTSKTDETAQVTEMASEATDYEEWVELEILPPKDQDDIDRLKTYLDDLAEVRTTELINLSESTLVEVCLSEPINLLKTLHGLSQVKQAREVEDGEQKKIQITLSTYTKLEESKDALRKKANDIFTGRR
jgi:hypothetical protein